MGYVTGQITSSASHLDDVITAIEAEMTAHPAWTFIEEYDISATVRYRIWRNEWDQNDWGESFYIAFAFDPNYGTTDDFSIKVFEDWDAGNKTAARGCPNPSRTQTIGADGSLRGTTYDSLGTSINADFYHCSRAYTRTNDVDFTYWAAVTKNCLIIFTSPSPYITYAGLFESFGASHVNEFPLAIVPILYGDDDYSGTCTRRPGEEGEYMYDAYAIEGRSHQWTRTDGTIPTSNYDFYGGGALGSRLYIDHERANVGPTVRGLYYDLLYFAVAAGVEAGDTITVQGSTWVYLKSNIWMNTQAP